MRRHTVLDSPIGPLTCCEEDGHLLRLWMGPVPDTAALGPRDDRALPALREQLDAYWDRRLRDFTLELRLSGTPFQVAVWQALRRIPYGQTWSYGRLATEIGRPTAVRAVGLANGRNPLGIVVPCHRVIGSSGKLTGYAGGLERKQFLLSLEAG